MKFCPNCQTSVKGDWVTCPLCSTNLESKDHLEQQESAFIEPPLRFDREKARREFMWAALGLIALYFITSLIYDFQFFGFNYVIFGLLVAWVITFVLLRDKENFAKGIVKLLIMISLASVFFDLYNGWIGWSLTFVIPILSIASLIGIIIGLQVINMKLNDYILYLQLLAILGLTPLLFLMMGWVAHPLPSIASIILSVIVFVPVFIRYRKLMIAELNKRLHF